ncbi:MAG: porin [Planctomycetota bacterium]
MSTLPLASQTRAASAPRIVTSALAGCAALAATGGSAMAQEPTVQDLLRRIEAQDQRIDALTNSSVKTAARYEVAYDKGYTIRSADKTSPFDLRINGRMQFRYSGFAPDDNSATGATSGFEIERGRLEFRGTFLDSGTHFYINMDADTDDNHHVVFQDFWINHDFSEDFSLYVGKAFVPGSREWIAGSTTTHLIDRSMSTTFFRPDRTIGIWAIGKFTSNWHYRVLVGNGVRTSDLKPSQIDTDPVYSGTTWWDALGKFGSGFADLEQHEELALRVGASVTYAKEEDGQLASNGEASFLHLSDGRQLTSDLGADSYNFKLGAADAALKFQGLAINCEAYWREVDAIRTPGNVNARRSYFDWGGYCDVGYMLLPKCLEVVGRVSTVQGFNDSWEYAGGINWYVNGGHTNKLSFDATKLDGSPVSNSSPNFRIGDDGWLVRLQWQIAF